MKEKLLGKTLDELRAVAAACGLPAFAGGQIAQWLYQKGATCFDEMTNLSKTARATLAERYEVGCVAYEGSVTSKDGTRKYLFPTAIPGKYIETVMIPDDEDDGTRNRATVCVSSQVGCKMGCTFCATGKSGFSRSLTASEMLAQIEAAQRDSGERISNIVLMGMGEPLDNYDNVVRFIRLVNSEDSLNIGARHITLSTCGLVPKIYALAKEGLPINLAVSLHAPNDEIRARTMPIAKVYPMDELLKACRDYFDTTGRRVTFEYAMIDGVNDSDECARELALRLGGMSCHVNLIPVNTVEGTGYSKSKLERQQSFVNILEGRGIAATVRRTLGSDINASCGQLRRKHLKKEDK